MAAGRLRRGHHHVARRGQRGVDHGIADHRGAEPVVGVAAAEMPLQQLDAQRLDLVDMASAGEPAVDPADMALRRPRADLRRQQRPYPRAGRRLGRQQVDAVLAAPLRVAADRLLHRLTHRCGVGAGVEHRPRRGQRLAVMHLDAVRQIRGIHDRASCSFESGYGEIIGNGFRFARPDFPSWNA